MCKRIQHSPKRLRVRKLRGIFAKIRDKMHNPIFVITTVLAMSGCIHTFGVINTLMIDGFSFRFSRLEHSSMLHVFNYLCNVF